MKVVRPGLGLDTPPGTKVLVENLRFFFLFLFFVFCFLFFVLFLLWGGGRKGGG